MTPKPQRSALALLAAALLLTTGLAGCLGQDDSGSTELEWNSYEEAKAADGDVFEPNETSPIRLKWLQPTQADQVPAGQSNLFVLLFNSDTDEPITDAEISLASRMPAMGHGTAAESDPAHEDFGVYKGVINPTMAGDWLLNLQVTLSDDATLGFQIGYTAQSSEGGMGDGNMSGGMNGSMGTTYESYQAAKDAPGRIYEPVEDNATLRLKLLEPETPANVSRANGNVTVLLFNQDADEPITDANMTLKAWMTSMGHGTSPESDPVHQAHGVYHGMTTYSMDGKWRLDLTSNHADGTTLTWQVPVDVGNTSNQWGEGPAPLFEPYNVTFEDSVEQQPMYSNTHAFDVKGANATLSVNFTFSGAILPVAEELTMTLFDANDTELGSLTVSTDSPEASLTINSAPMEGEYTIDVEGQAVDATYTIEIGVTPPPV